MKAKIKGVLETTYTIIKKEKPKNEETKSDKNN